MRIFLKIFRISKNRISTLSLLLILTAPAALAAKDDGEEDDSTTEKIEATAQIGCPFSAKNPGVASVIAQINGKAINLPGGCGLTYRNYFNAGGMNNPYAALFSNGSNPSNSSGFSANTAFGTTGEGELNNGGSPTRSGPSDSIGWGAISDLSGSFLQLYTASSDDICFNQIQKIAIETTMANGLTNAAASPFKNNVLAQSVVSNIVALAADLLFKQPKSLSQKIVDQIKKEKNDDIAACIYYKAMPYAGECNYRLTTLSLVRKKVEDLSEKLALEQDKLKKTQTASSSSTIVTPTPSGVASLAIAESQFLRAIDLVANSPSGEGTEIETSGVSGHVMDVLEKAMNQQVANPDRPNPAAIKFQDLLMTLYQRELTKGKIGEKSLRDFLHFYHQWNTPPSPKDSAPTDSTIPLAKLLRAMPKYDGETSTVSEDAKGNKKYLPSAYFTLLLNDRYPLPAPSGKSPMELIQASEEAKRQFLKQMAAEIQTYKSQISEVDNNPSSSAANHFNMGEVQNDFTRLLAPDVRRKLVAEVADATKNYPRTSAQLKMPETACSNVRRAVAACTLLQGVFFYGNGKVTTSDGPASRLTPDDYAIQEYSSGGNVLNARGQSFSDYCDAIPGVLHFDKEDEGKACSSVNPDPRKPLTSLERIQVNECAKKFTEFQCKKVYKPGALDGPDGIIAKAVNQFEKESGLSCRWVDPSPTPIEVKKNTDTGTNATSGDDH